MFRETLLNRLRGLRDDSTRLPAAPVAGQPMPDLFERFRQEAERVSTVVLDGRPPSSPAARLEEVLAATGADNLCWEPGFAFGRYGLRVQAPARELGSDVVLVTRHTDGKVTEPLSLDTMTRDRKLLAGVPVSVSAARYGVAETGSLVESTGPGVGRVLPILAPAHVVLLRSSDLVSSQLDLVLRLAPGAAGSAQLLMTGPSRTADIEKILILGVHGPRDLFVILVEG